MDSDKINFNLFLDIEIVQELFIFNLQFLGKMSMILEVHTLNLCMQTKFLTSDVHEMF